MVKLIFTLTNVHSLVFGKENKGLQFPVENVYLICRSPVFPPHERQSSEPVF